jgi:hypothetical protein
VKVRGSGRAERRQGLDYPRSELKTAGGSAIRSFQALACKLPELSTRGFCAPNLVLTRIHG